MKGKQGKKEGKTRMDSRKREVCVTGRKEEEWREERMSERVGGKGGREVGREVRLSRRK